MTSRLQLAAVPAGRTSQPPRPQSLNRTGVHAQQDGHETHINGQSLKYVADQQSHRDREQHSGLHKMMLMAV